MEKAIIAGATGLVGTELINSLMIDNRYDKIISLVRTPQNIDDNKLLQIKADFENLHSNSIEIKPTHAFCCLGTTIKKAGSKEKQFKIDHDYVINFANYCKSIGVEKFSVVSSLGANENSSNFYLRTKGQMESNLQKIGFKSLFILRPSILLGNRKEFRLGEKIGIAVMSVFSPLLFGKFKKYKGIKAKKVANCMINILNSNSLGIEIIESDRIF